MSSPTFDFSVFDNQELVTYTPLVGAAVSNVPAVRRPLTQSRQRNVERYVTLQVSDVIFHVDGTPLASTSLAVGDTITDADSIATASCSWSDRRSAASWWQLADRCDERSET